MECSSKFRYQHQRGGNVFRVLEGNALIEAKIGIIAHEYTENPAVFYDADIDYVTSFFLSVL